LARFQFRQAIGQEFRSFWVNKPNAVAIALLSRRDCAFPAVRKGLYRTEKSILRPRFHVSKASSLAFSGSVCAALRQFSDMFLLGKIELNTRAINAKNIEIWALSHAKSVRKDARFFPFDADISRSF
jgi:hypothetical protein